MLIYQLDYLNDKSVMEGKVEMNDISPKERLLQTLGKNAIDRAPVICPGGMMNAAIAEVMNKCGHTLPEAHHDEKLMAGLSHDVYTQTGFENFGIPFCMTIEAEVLGSEVNYGTLTCEPKIQNEIFPSVSKVQFQEIGSLLNKGRINTVLQAEYILSRRYTDVPVVGNLTGPVSTAASIVDPMTFLKELRKDSNNAHRLMDYITNFLIAYAQLMVENGASIISIGDPTATGEILGPKMFAQYALPYINKLADGIHAVGAPVIVHICGNMGPVKNQLPQLRADAISTDAMVNLRLLKEEFPQITTMGNISTYLLEFGTPDKVALQAQKLVDEGINIISPACGLSTSSSLDNINALTRTVKEQLNAKR